MAMSSPAPPGAYLVFDILLKTVAAASLLGILIMVSLITAKLNTHITNIDENIEKISEYLQRISYAFYPSAETVYVRMYQ